MFGAALDAVAAQRVPELARLFEPGLHALAHGAAVEVVLAALTVLFEAALIECGATPCSSLGETCAIYELDGERVQPGELVARLPKEAEVGGALRAWSLRLMARGLERSTTEGPNVRSAG